MTKVTAPDGGNIIYRYNAQGLLASVTDRAKGINVDTLTAQILFFGALAIAFGGFASFMADRQTQREKRSAIEPPTLL